VIPYFFQSNHHVSYISCQDSKECISMQPWTGENEVNKFLAILLQSFFLQISDMNYICSHTTMSPGPVTRSQTAMSPRPVTRSQAAMSPAMTPVKSPPKSVQEPPKKLTPKRRKLNMWSLFYSWEKDILCCFHLDLVCYQVCDVWSTSYFFNLLVRCELASVYRLPGLKQVTCDSSL
jgi:hypothetical protein